MIYEKKMNVDWKLLHPYTLKDNKKEMYYLNYFNNWVAVFICLWFAWPFMNYRLGLLPLIFVLAAWFFTTDMKWVFKRLSFDLVFIVIWFLSFLPYIFTGKFYFGNLNPIYALICFSLFFVGIFVNHYYMFFKQNGRALRNIALFTILFFIIASVQSYLGLRQYPLAARVLATGSDPLMQTYVSLGIGGFGFVYSAVFVNIALLYFIITRDSKIRLFYRFLALFAYIIITMMLISASYATSLLFLFIGTLLVFFIRGKKSLIFCILFAIIMILLIPKEMIGYLLIDVANLFKENGVINSKFMDLAKGFVTDSFGSQTNGRGQLYLESLDTFFHNPLFGIYGPFGDSFNAKVGGHSGWLDLLAYYGLFGSLPLFAAIFFLFRKQLKFYANHPYTSFILTAQILFVIFGFINPFLYVYQIGFVLFTVIPALPYLSNAFLKNGEERNT